MTNYFSSLKLIINQKFSYNFKEIDIWKRLKRIALVKIDVDKIDKRVNIVILLFEKTKKTQLLYKNDKKEGCTKALK